MLGKSQNNTPRNAKEFHEFIDQEHSRIDAAVVAFNEGIVMYDGDTILKAYDAMLKTTESVIEKTEKVSVLKGAENYHRAALDLFRFYLRTFETDYYEAVSIMYREIISDADIDEMEKIFDRVELKEIMVLNEYYRQQDAFCEENNIGISN